ncbi:MAG: glycosyltransferase family 2 protein [Solirubrobacteraceae bacterium]
MDVVVPFSGTDEQLGGLVARLSVIRRGPGDTVVIADNRPRARTHARGDIDILATGDFRGSYHARNAGARLGSAPWLLFIDSDATATPDLLDRLFEQVPSERTAVLAGAVVDEPPEPGTGTLAQRYAWLKSSMSQEHTLGHESAAFAQTANCAVRRDAFAAIGGFADQVRSGGDADLCLRLARAGWELESRPGAAVIHHNRATVPRMLAQRARHGAGAGWLSREHPEALPARSFPGVLWWGARRAATGIGRLARGDRDAAIMALLDGPAVIAFEVGRRLPNRRLLQPLRRHRR